MLNLRADTEGGAVATGVRPAACLPVLTLMLALAGCASTPTPTEADGTVVVACGRHAFVAILGDEQATVYLPGLALSLTRVPSRQGKRYTGHGHELHKRSTGVLFSTPGGRWGGCHLSRAYNAWANAWVRGIRFRAVGRQPDWVLEIGRGRWLRLVWNNGHKKLEMILPQARMHHGLVTYQRTTQQHRVRIEIMDHVCRAPVAGRLHSYAVRVRVDDQVLYGCGRGLVPVSRGL